MFGLKCVSNDVFIKVSFSVWKVSIIFCGKWNDIKAFLFIKSVKGPAILLYFPINC